MFGKKDAPKEEEKKEETKQEEGKKDAPEEKGVSNMRSGDYMVHVFIEKVKEINVPENGTVDPMFECECLGQKIHSSAKDDIGFGEIVYAEHLFMEPRGVDKKQAEDGKIMIKLMDKGMFKQTLIGQFELDMGFIYSQKDHALLHRWLAFSNPNGEDYAKIQAYVKVSISVSCEGDNQIQIEMDDSPNENPNVMMSPALNPRFFQVKIRIFSGHDLPMMDSGIGPFTKEKIDAYMKLDFKGKKYKTPIIVYQKGGEPIHWNTEFWLPCQLPVAAPQIPIRLMDEDDIGSDEMAATLLLYTKEIIENKHKDNPARCNGAFRWVNMYGSPMNQSDSKEKREMNENPEYASTWKGRILIQITAEETEKPLAKQCPIDQEIVAQAKEFLKQKSYSMICNVGQAVALPSTDKYNMRVTVGGHEMILKPFDQKKPVTSKRFEQKQVTFKSYNQSIADFETVIVQLMDGDDPIMYYRDKIEKFTNPNPERLEWYQFIPDKCVKKVKEPDQVGQFSFKLSLVSDEYENFDFKKQNGKQSFWKEPSKRLVPIKVRAYIFQCKNLPAADEGGTSDPFIKAWDTTRTQKKSKKTRIVEDNCNPLFYECLELEYEVEKQNDLLTYPPFIFDIYDHDDDLFDSTPDYLCRCIVEPEDCRILMEEDFEKCLEHKQEKCQICASNNVHNEIPKEPKWHPCYYAPGQPMCGELLISFSVSKDDFEYHVANPEEVNLDELVPKAEQRISMNILGLRNLESPGILPVKKAFVKFAIKSLVPPNGPALKDIQTTPSQAGPNPTLNTTTHFTIPLPIDKLFCPQLTCFVYDNVFAGFSQPLIGVFVLPLGELKDALALERKEETEVIKNIINSIKELCSDDLNDLNLTTLGKTEARGTSVTGQRLSTKQGPQINESQVSDFNDNKFPIQTQKKRKVQKVFEEQKDFQEAFGANEDEGEANALIKKETQLQLVEQKKKEIMESQKPESVAGSRRGSNQSSLSKMSKKEAMSQIQQMKDMESRILEDERTRQREGMIMSGQDSTAIVIMPQYEVDKRLSNQKLTVWREVNIPPKEIFIPLGWDEDNETKRKHYRHYYHEELEKVTELFEKPSPFNTYKLIKGQSRGTSGGLFKATTKDESGQVSTEKVTGIFKAIIEVENPEAKDAYLKKKEQMLTQLQTILGTLWTKRTNTNCPYEVKKLDNPKLRKEFDLETRKLGIDHLHISKALTNLNSDEILKQALLRIEKCIIRFYAIEGFNMMSRDNGSDSDTYLKLECNGKVVSERDNYQLDEPNPKFYKSYDFEGYFPGSSPLTISVWDYDMVFGDELIGTSVMDLEDRYFTLDWMALTDKPVEYRNLYFPASKMSQGVVKCWLEIIKVNDKPEEKPQQYDITPKPPYDVEVRVCVHNCKDIPMMDAEGTCDAFFKCFFDTKEEVQETDTHYRNQDGKPDFQYRLVYKKAFPTNTTKLTLQGYDRDFFSSNEMFGEANIDIGDLLEDVALTKTMMQLNKKYYQEVIQPKYKDNKKESLERKLEFDSKDDNKIWINLYAMDKKKNKKVKKGQVCVQVAVLPIAMALANPVGKARDNPNHSPTLPQPQGRLELSFNPIKMFNQLVGPAVRRKIYMACCCALCCFLLLMSLPNVLGGLIVNLL